MGLNVHNVSIERATPAHADGILALAQANGPEHGGELTGEVPREPLLKTIGMLPNIVAIIDGRVVGFLLSWERAVVKNPCVMAMFEHYPGSRDCYSYGPICVDAALRGRGIAGAMFAKLTELLPEREGVLFIKAGNYASIRAHLKMGMRQTAEYLYDGRLFLVFAYNTPDA